jgi:hypothetical protein
LKVARREVLASDQHHRLLGEQCDRCEIGSGVVGKLLIERRVIGLSTDAAEQEHITVRCGLCDAIGADNARRPTDVFDNYLLAQGFAQPLRKDSTHDIESAARGERHHHGHWSRRPFLRPGGCVHGREGRKDRNDPDT